MLHEECAHEKEICINLEDCQCSQEILIEAEELGDLDERIEGLDAQAEYVTLSIAEYEREILEGITTKYDFFSHDLPSILSFQLSSKLLARN